MLNSYFLQGTVNTLFGGNKISTKRLENGNTSIDNLEFSYPLRFIQLKSSSSTHAIVCAQSFGGGLVSGDAYHIEINVSDSTNLSYITQSSTKVFKKRSNNKKTNLHSIFPKADIIQSLHTRIGSGSFFCLLPEPTTCFADSSFEQYQTFSCDKTASLVILDWITCGRKSRNEVWMFERYASRNIIEYDEIGTVYRDGLLLENDVMKFKDRLEPYFCYATLVCYGERIGPLHTLLTDEFQKLTIIKNTLPDLIWSVSSIKDSKGCVFRGASKQVHEMKDFLTRLLEPLKGIIGENPFY